MCGIIMTYNKETNTNELASEIYQDQRSRGTKGFGIYTEKGKIYRATDETKFLIDLSIRKSKLLVLHHRQPTSTNNKINQTHPIVWVTNEAKYSLFHNGIIINPEKIKQNKLYTTETEPDIYGRNKFNDSEALLDLLVDLIENNKKLPKDIGNYAFILVKETDDNKEIFIGRNNGRPLIVSEYKDSLIISSEMHINKNALQSTEELEEDGLYKVNLETKKIELITKLTEEDDIGFDTMPELTKEDIKDEMIEQIEELIESMEKKETKKQLKEMFEPRQQDNKYIKEIKTILKNYIQDIQTIELSEWENEFNETYERKMPIHNQTYDRYYPDGYNTIQYNK